MPEILILSPHLDDAVLSCFDHITAWKKNNENVFIVSIFTRFGINNTHLSIRKRLKETGFSSCKEQERTRKKEDVRAMNAIGASWEHLNYTDAGYRMSGRKVIYLNSNSLFSGKISPYDHKLIKSIEPRLNKLKKVDKILIPLGVGRNIDHVIVKKIAEKLFKPKQIIYYLDYPYALSISNWSVSNLLKLFLKRKSLRKTTERKRKVMRLYSSQYKLYFRKPPNYPETLLY